MRCRFPTGPWTGWWAGSRQTDRQVKGDWEEVVELMVDGEEGRNFLVSYYTNTLICETFTILSIISI